MSVALRFAAVRSGDRARAIAAVVDTDRLAPLVIGPGLLLVLGAGFGLVHEGRSGYDHLWIQLGFAGFVASNAIAVSFNLPSRRRLEVAAQRGGADEPGTGAILRRLQIASYADLVVLAGVLFVMTTKETL